MVITHNMMSMNANRQFGINDKQKAKYFTTSRTVHDCTG